MKAFFKNSLTFPLFLFFLSVLIINPWGEFVINDDWLFSRQVLAFTLGQFKINSMIDPVFILQGLLGYVWVSLFGFSHSALRILTILITVGTSWGLHKTLTFYDVSTQVKKLVMLLFLFNPLVYTSAFSFMTENYFLLFFIWSIYFYLKTFQYGNRKDLLLASLFTGMSFLIRQVGIFTLFAFLLVRFLFRNEKPGKIFQDLILGSLPVIGAMIVFALWPRYPQEIAVSSADFLTNTLKGIAGLKNFRQMWPLYLFSFSYFSYFLLPLAFYHPIPIPRITTKLKLLLSSLLLTYPIYYFDLFPIGSVFYLEGLHVKSMAQQNFSLFDNIAFKLFLAFLISNSLSYLAYAFWRKGRIYLEKHNAFLIILALANFTVLIIASDFYDRYLLVPFVPLLILVVTNIFELYEIKTSSKIIPVLLTTGLFIFISFSLQWEYYSRTRLSWQQAGLLSKKYQLTTNIYLAGPYDKYMKAVKDEDFSGYNEKPTGDHQCYVYDYTLDTDSKFLSQAENLHKKIERKLLENPRIYGGRKPEGQPKVKNNLDKLEYNEKYSALHYNLIGKETYVGSFCPEE